MQNNAYKSIKFGTLTQLTCFMFLLKIEEMFWSYRKCAKIEVWRKLGRVTAENLFAETSWAKYLKQSKKN